jgi:hypothetical protein
MRRSSFLTVLVVLASIAACAPAAPIGPAQPSVGMWYRGRAGVPKLDDLAVMKAVDFSSVTWPAGDTAGLTALKKLAATIGLSVIPRDSVARLTPAVALSPGQYVDVLVPQTPPALITPLVWRAVAHGARVVSFDPGLTAGSGLNDINGAPPVWLPAAKAIARTLSFNAQLIEDFRPGPTLRVDDPKPADFDVVFLDVGKSWAVIATSLAQTPIRAVVHFPKDVPYALWVSMLDGSNMSMLSQPEGPVWTVNLPPNGTEFCVIEKILK